MPIVLTMLCSALEVVTPKCASRQLNLRTVFGGPTLGYTSQCPQNIIELFPLPKSIPNGIVLRQNSRQPVDSGSIIRIPDSLWMWASCM